MLCVDGLEAHREGEFQLDAVAGLPLAMYRCEVARDGKALLARAIDRDGRSLRPFGNAEVQGQLGRVEVVTVKVT